jgi:hypothetical protein
MAEEVKPKATAAKTKVAEKTPEVIETPVQVEEVVKSVAPVVAKAKEEPKVAEEAPEVKAPVVAEVVVAEVVDASDDDVEIMSRRGRKAKSEKIAEFAHELSVKMHNEPHLESLYREEYAEKVAKLK